MRGLSSKYHHDIIQNIEPIMRSNVRERKIDEILS